MVFLANTTSPSFCDYRYADRDGRAEDADAIRYLAVTHLELGWDLLDDTLEGKTFLMGNSPTVPDFMVVCMVIWLYDIPTDALKRKNLRRLVRKMMERESWKEFENREDIRGSRFLRIECEIRWMVDGGECLTRPAIHPTIIPHHLEDRTIDCLMHRSEACLFSIVTLASENQSPRIKGPTEV